MYQKYTIENEYNHVYNFLKEIHISERYMSFLRKEMGYIKINGSPVNIKAPLHIHDTLEIIADNVHKSTIMHCILPLDIVYEDEYYLLVNKSSGLSTIPNKSHYDHNLAGAIANYLSDKLPKFTLRVINRLDKDTSGIVMVAKNLIAYNSLTKTNKVYHALCNGIIDKSIIINKPIATLKYENGINQRKRIISEDGKSAVTYVEPIKTYQSYSLISLTLEHGRTHQIRVHLSSIGHPLLGDELYGYSDEHINHTALICKDLSFYHPFLKKTLNFSVEYPEDFNKLI